VETEVSLSTTEYAVLGLLAFGESSGYDLARYAERSIDYMWAPSRSQIYKVLPRLVERELAESREIAQRSRPDKALFRITPAGLASLRSWVEHVEGDPPGGAPVFLLKLFFGWAAPPEAARAQLEAYRRLLEKHLGAFEDMERAPLRDEPVHSRIALLHGITRARATLAWVEKANTLLEADRGSLSASRRTPR
jgi:PadR family transcriptional regulator, regulatory protein AphA